MLILLLALQAPAGPRSQPEAELPPPPTPPELLQDLPAAPQTPGSLWSEVPARQLMGLDGNARQVGDLVTVRISDRSATSLDATTSAQRDSSTEAGISALLGAEQRIFNTYPGMNGELKVGGGLESTFDGRGTTTRDATIEATLTCHVIEVYPNGNLRIWGQKEIRVNREIQTVTLEGIARARDIQLNNTIDSTLLALSDIQVTGGGVLADKQGPGFLARIADRVWPF